MTTEKKETVFASKTVNLFEPEEDRFSLFPIKHPKVFAFYETIESVHWRVGEVDSSNDRSDYEKKCTPGDRKCLKYITGFFSVGDELVLENLDKNVLPKICIKEFQYVYRAMSLQECIHSHSYSVQIDTIFSGKEKEEVFEAVKNMKVIKEMKSWVDKYMLNDVDFEVRLIIFICVESIFFADKFAAIQSFKERNLISGICLYNEYISRDENIHIDYAIFLITDGYVKKPDEDLVHKLFKQAVSLSYKFIDESIDANDPPLGLSVQSLKRYAEFNADIRLEQLGYKKMYNIPKNPLSFMEAHAMNRTNKTDFFTKNSTNYQTLSKDALVYKIDESPIKLV